jgi:hypothetical protein
MRHDQVSGLRCGSHPRPNRRHDPGERRRSGVGGGIFWPGPMRGSTGACPRRKGKGVVIILGHCCSWASCSRSRLRGPWVDSHHGRVVADDRRCRRPSPRRAPVPTDQPNPAARPGLMTESVRLPSGPPGSVALRHRPGTGSREPPHSGESRVRPPSGDPDRSRLSRPDMVGWTQRGLRSRVGQESASKAGRRRSAVRGGARQSPRAGCCRGGSPNPPRRGAGVDTIRSRMLPKSILKV